MERTEDSNVIITNILDYYDPKNDDNGDGEETGITHWGGIPIIDIEDDV